MSFGDRRIPHLFNLPIVLLSTPVRLVSSAAMIMPRLHEGREHRPPVNARLLQTTFGARFTPQDGNWVVNSFARRHERLTAFGTKTRRLRRFEQLVFHLAPLLPAYLYAHILTLPQANSYTEPRTAICTALKQSFGGAACVQKLRFLRQSPKIMLPTAKRKDCISCIEKTLANCSKPKPDDRFLRYLHDGAYTILADVHGMRAGASFQRTAIYEEAG